MKLKLCNNGLSVFGQREDGMFVSYSIEADEYKQWLSDGNTPEPEFTEEELKLKAELEAMKEADRLRSEAMIVGDTYTLNGVEYIVSFTKNDGDGLVQVKSAFELGLTSTVIVFENGTKLPIKAEEFMSFASWFVTKRNGFFE